MSIDLFIYIYIERERERERYTDISNTSLYSLLPLNTGTPQLKPGMHLRPNVVLIIFRPRIFESKFRDHCAKKLDGALRKPTSLV